MRLGTTELILILVIVIVLFGHRTIPKLFASLKGMIGKNKKKKEDKAEEGSNTTSNG